MRLLELLLFIRRVELLLKKWKLLTQLGLVYKRLNVKVLRMLANLGYLHQEIGKRALWVGEMTRTTKLSVVINEYEI